MTIHQALLPCRRFDVLVTYHAFDGLTPLEANALRAIAAGARSVDMLVEHLGTPQRLVLDVCIDLLGAGAIEIDGEGALVASPTTLKRMGGWQSPKAGWEASFATSSAPPPDVVALMQEMVSGEVFRAIPRQSDFRGGLHQLPIDPDLPPLDTIGRTELLAAVLARPIRLAGSGPAADADDFRPRRARIGEVRMRRPDIGSDPTQPALPTSIQRIQVDLVGMVIEEDMAPRLAVLGPDTVPAVVRQRVGSRLAALWDRGCGRGPGQIFDILRFEASEAEAFGVRAELPEVAVDRLQTAIDAVEGVGGVADHEHFIALERDAGAAVLRAVGAGAGAALVDGAAAHHDALREALETAKEQVVVACPWVRRLEDPAVRAMFRSALKREPGLRIVVVWGISADEPVPTGLALLRDELAPEHGARFCFADRAARSHAKAIVCDHSWAIVTSSNFLSSGPDRATSELGVRLSSPPPRLDPDPADTRGVSSHPITEILRWAKAALTVPDYRVARELVDSPVLFGLATAGRRVAEAPPILPPDSIALAQKLWRAEWMNRIAEFRQELGRARPYAIPVDSASHRDLMFDAIATARHRVSIESPSVSAAATSAPFVEAVLEARERGVEITLRFAKREAAGPEGDARWARLVSSGVRMVEADTHAKVLVCDDWIIVTSFNFLSFEGRRRRELGVQVVDSALADTVASRFRTVGSS
jgi:phosphatidylserine/phosphatidylglycerophosphate/cardiolipin synthase-like enzyme